MGLFSIEHSPAAYRADFWVYGAAVALLAATLQLGAPAGMALELLLLALAGVASWTLGEYLLHRFVLHGLPPFSRWHAEHHQRPTALIGSPTILSASLIVLLVFLPAWLWSNIWPAIALSLGVAAGYLGYSVMHHAMHHWRSDQVWFKSWFRQRQRCHALHHRRQGRPGCFGVTNSFWDQVFGTRSEAGLDSAA